MNSDVTLVNEIESAVEASAQLMDDVRPGWFNDVDLDDFDIQDPNRCVLCQAFGTFEGGIKGLRSEGREWSDYAFSAYETIANTELTNHAWRRAIEHRKVA